MADRCFVRAALLAILSFGCIRQIPAVPAPTNDDLILTVFDCGYGDSLLLSHHGRHLVIDGGYPSFGPAFLAALDALGVRSVDAVFLTHPHPDHIGGAYAVLASDRPVDGVYACHPASHPEMPVGIREACERRQIPWHAFCAGERYRFGDRIELEALHPGNPGPDLNETSLVLMVRYGACRLLLPADIGSGAQGALARTDPQALKCDVLKAPHHGGDFDYAFLRAAAPSHVLLSVGMNPYGNPWDSFLWTCRMIGAAVHRTDEAGTIQCRIVPSGRIRIVSIPRLDD